MTTIPAFLDFGTVIIAFFASLAALKTGRDMPEKGLNSLKDNRAYFNLFLLFLAVANFHDLFSAVYSMLEGASSTAETALAISTFNLGTIFIIATMYSFSYVYAKCAEYVYVEEN